MVQWSLDAIDWDEELNLENINVSISNWKSLFLQIMEMSIPYKLSCAKPSLPWLSRKVARAIRKRNALFNLAKLSQAPADMRRYKNQRNRTLSLLRKSKKDYMAQLSSNDSKKFWKTVKVINTSEQSIPTLQANGVTLETAESKAEALNQYFYSTFNHCYPALQPSAFMSDKHLHFNTSKCKVMLISNKRSRSIDPPAFTVNGFPLERVETFKYLGIQFSSDLSWHSHTKALCKNQENLLDCCTETLQLILPLLFVEAA